MGRKKAGGYIFEWYKGDHEPFHIHIYEDDDFIGRFDIIGQKPMGGWVLTSKIKKALKQVGFYFEEKNKWDTPCQNLTIMPQRSWKK